MVLVVAQMYGIVGEVRVMQITRLTIGQKTQRKRILATTGSETLWKNTFTQHLHHFTFVMMAGRKGRNSFVA